MYRKQFSAVFILSIWLIFIPFKGWSQQTSPDSSSYEQKTIPPTEISLLYSFYEQKGQNSAVTGGRGNEHLTDHATKVKVYLPFKPNQAFSLEAGVDLITSASVDKIDFRVSSASRKDARTYGRFGYYKKLEKKGIEWGSTISGSIESDYISGGLGFSLNKRPKNEAWEIQINGQAYFDNLRWGWLDQDYYKMPYLIYPAELRDTNWFDHSNRFTYALSIGYFHILNQRLKIGVFTDLVQQEGLLSTTFHRVYFQDGTSRVENLPRVRRKLALGARIHYFGWDFLILRSYLRLYTDNFGIQSFTTNLEIPIKLNYWLSVFPFGRFYIQDGTSHFARFQEHDPESTFYTSDFDLSAFRSFKFGGGLQFNLFHTLFFKQLSIRNIQFRYAHYNRSDGLSTNILSLSLGFQLNRSNKSIIP